MASRKTIHEYFSKFGEILKLKLEADKATKMFKGVARVTFKDPISREILKISHKINGRAILVSEENAKHQKMDKKTQIKIQKQNQIIDDNKRKIFVGGLPLTVDNLILKNYFEQFGEVNNANIVYHHENAKSRGFGFVIFKELTTLKKVLEMHDDHFIYGKWIDCKKVEVKDKSGRLEEEKKTSAEGLISDNKKQKTSESGKGISKEVMQNKNKITIKTNKKETVKTIETIKKTNSKNPNVIDKIQKEQSKAQVNLGKKEAEEEGESSSGESEYSEGEEEQQQSKRKQQGHYRYPPHYYQQDPYARERAYRHYGHSAGPQGPPVYYSYGDPYRQHPSYGGHPYPPRTLHYYSQEKETYYPHHHHPHYDYQPQQPYPQNPQFHSHPQYQQAPLSYYEPQYMQPREYYHEVEKKYSHQPPVYYQSQLNANPPYYSNEELKFIKTSQYGKPPNSYGMGEQYENAISRKTETNAKLDEQ